MVLFFLKNFPIPEKKDSMRKHKSTLFLLLIISGLVFLIGFSISESIGYKIYRAKKEGRLATYDNWELIALKCNEEKTSCTESTKRLITPFYNDSRIFDLRRTTQYHSFRLNAQVSQIPGIEAILANETFSIVIPKTDSHSVSLAYFKPNTQKPAFFKTQLARGFPVSFFFQRGDEYFPSFEKEDQLQIDFHLPEKGWFGTPFFPIGFVTDDFHEDFLFSTIPRGIYTISSLDLGK